MDSSAVGEPSRVSLRSAISNSEKRHSYNRSVTIRDNKDECVEKYKNHFSFLRDSKFLQDLENDSVDSDIIEEELTALQEVPISTREKVVKFLQSNPVQILLCVIVLLDAGIVIAQILLDLNSVKDKLYRRDQELSGLLRYIKDTQSSKLRGYTGEDVELILRLLYIREEANETKAANQTNLISSSPSTLQKSKTTRPGNKSRPGGPLDSGGADGGDIVPLHRPPNEGDLGDTSNEESSSTDQNPLDMREFRLVEIGEHDLLHEIAHGLHFASIAMLGFLVIEDLIKILAMGKTFFKHKIEIFDAIIITFSFAIDIVFLGGVTGEEGQKAAAVLVILLLWRIARVVDGIIVTVKQRQEFRIRLQKRARRIAEKKLETFEEERHARTRQIEALKDLCSKAGIAEADIAACGPKHAKQVNTTLCALSSVARLSVSMTMLMSSGIYRPRILDDGLILPRVFGPKTREQANHGGGSASQPRRGLLPRIESLPIMQNSGSGKQRATQRKSTSGKTYRKQRSGPSSKNYHQTVVESATEDGVSRTTIDSVSSCASAVDPDQTLQPINHQQRSESGGEVHLVNDDIYSPAGLQTPSSGAPSACVTPLSQSPVNSSGVCIVIDKVSDEGSEMEALGSDPRDDVRAPPTSDSTNDVKAPPTSDPTNDVRAPPISDPTNDVRAPPTSDPTNDVRAPPTSDPTNDVRAPPTSDSTNDLRAPSFSDPTNDVRAPPISDPINATSVFVADVPTNSDVIASVTSHCASNSPQFLLSDI